MSKEYLFQIKILSKKDADPLESIAYYSGETQFDILNKNKEYISTTNKKVIWNKIFIPHRDEQRTMFSNLPEFLKFRSEKQDIISNARNILWKNISDKDIRPDSQFSRLFKLSIPHFLTKEESVNLVSEFCTLLVAEGMITDSSIHSHNKKTPNLSIAELLKFMQTPKNEQAEFNDKPQDYSSFVMCTLRDYQEGRFVNKNRSWNNPLKLKEWRSQWVKLLSFAIENASNVTDEDKKSWQNKMEIFPEYKEEKKKQAFSI